MITVVFGWLAALAVLGLGFYAVRRTPPGSFRLRTGLLKGMFEFIMEIEASDRSGCSAGQAAPGVGHADTQDESPGPTAPSTLE